MNTQILDRAAAALATATEATKIAYLERIAKAWDNQAAVDYMAAVLLGT